MEANTNLPTRLVIRFLIITPHQAAFRWVIHRTLEIPLSVGSETLGRADRKAPGLLSSSTDYVVVQPIGAVISAQLVGPRSCIQTGPAEPLCLQSAAPPHRSGIPEKRLSHVNRRRLSSFRGVPIRAVSEQRRRNWRIRPGLHMEESPLLAWLHRSTVAGSKPPYTRRPTCRPET